MRKLDNVFKAVMFAVLAFAFYELKADTNIAYEQRNQGFPAVSGRY